MQVTYHNAELLTDTSKDTIINHLRRKLMTQERVFKDHNYSSYRLVMQNDYINGVFSLTKVDVFHRIRRDHAHLLTVIL